MKYDDALTLAEKILESLGERFSVLVRPGYGEREPGPPPPSDAMRNLVYKIADLILDLTKRDGNKSVEDASHRHDPRQQLLFPGDSPSNYIKRTKEDVSTSRAILFLNDAAEWVLLDSLPNSIRVLPQKEQIEARKLVASILEELESAGLSLPKEEKNRYM